MKLFCEEYIDDYDGNRMAEKVLGFIDFEECGYVSDLVDYCGWKVKYPKRKVAAVVLGNKETDVVLAILDPPIDVARKIVSDINAIYEAGNKSYCPDSICKEYDLVTITWPNVGEIEKYIEHESENTNEFNIAYEQLKNLKERF